MNLFDRNQPDDIDEIDAALNASLQDASHQPASDVAADTLTTHRMAMSAICADPAAKGPAAGTWNGVLRATTTATAQPVSKGHEEMSVAIDYRGTPYRPGPSHHHASGRSFVSVAASLLVISVIAFAGWFANSHFRLDPDQGPRLAVLGLQPSLAGNGVCDVEPLTVDEAVSIIRNPLSNMGLSEKELQDRGFPPSLYRDARNTMAVDSGLPESLGSQGTIATSEERYLGYADVANEFLDCAVNGSVGQIWRFVDPVRVQWYLQNWLPFMMTEEEAEELLPPILANSGNGIWTGSDEVAFLANVRPQVSASPVDAVIPISPMNLNHFSYLVDAPILFTDAQGAMMDTPIGTPVVIDGVLMGRNIVMGKSLVDGGWYVVGVYNPAP